MPLLSQQIITANLPNTPKASVPLGIQQLLGKESPGDWPQWEVDVITTLLSRQFLPGPFVPSLSRLDPAFHPAVQASGPVWLRLNAMLKRATYMVRRHWWYICINLSVKAFTTTVQDSFQGLDIYVHAASVKLFCPGGGAVWSGEEQFDADTAVPLDGSESAFSYSSAVLLVLPPRE